MSLLYEKDGFIAKVGLNRPEAKNALNPQLLMELLEAWREADRDDQIRAVVLYSALPDIFCAGMDLKSFIPILTRARGPETEAERWIVENPEAADLAMLKPNTLSKPVLAAVHGYCLTGGFETVMGADLRLASEDAVFQMREASLGIMPTGGSNIYLPRTVAPCRALEILLTADNYSADRLYEWGFLNRVVPGEKLMDETMAMAEKIVANGPLAVRGIIRCHREGRDLTYKDGFNLEREIGLPVFGSRDAREGVQAQREKRPPNFPGRF